LVEHVIVFENPQNKQKGEFSGLRTFIFVKVPQLGDSEGTFAVFESSFQLLLPV